MIKKSLPQYPDHFSVVCTEVQFRAFRWSAQGLSTDAVHAVTRAAGGRVRDLARDAATAAISANSFDPKDRWET
ncbi:hypothetical protein [Streptomyces asoensis]|uniref:hypothetical protein n=1 Tax=Streptomyces asoensis TaxID=249586 RepID=UPI0034074D9C